MDELERELKVGFLDEAQQLLQDAEQCFLQIETQPNDEGVINTLFRLAHNLKGSAKAVGFDQMGEFTHKLESLLLKIKNREISVDSGIVTLLLSCKDQIQLMIDSLKADLDAKFDCSDLSAQLEAATLGQAVAAKEEPSASAEEVPLPNPEEVPATPLQEIAVELVPDVPPASEFKEEEIPVTPVAAEITLAVPSTPVAATPPTSNAGKSAPTTAPADESIRVSLSRLDKLINYVGEMVILQSVLYEQAHSGNLSMIRKTVHQLGKVSKDVQDISMSLRMVPLKQTFQKMQRIVRDTSQALNKKVGLTIKGEETELEKTVLELIGDPLVHLVRNAVDHGIDSVEERLEKGKPEAGHVILQASHQADQIVIEVKDDGKGIDAEKLRQKALEKGILKPGQVITDKAAVNLIFHPGFSTKAQVTDISGRGVGLDVVKTNIERLQGTVDVSTEVGKGTTFRIQLPLTLAIIDATTVVFNGQRFAIPMTHIYESLQISEKEIQSSVNAGEMYLLRGQNLPVFRLSKLLDLKTPTQNQVEPRILLVSGSPEAPFGVLVHDISSMQQIVIKKLGKELSHLEGITGSAILGDGKAALILDLPRLAQKQVKKMTGFSTPGSARLSA